MTRLLILGGTTEASELAHAIAAAGLDAVFSYAGRTESPASQPLPMRIGGFGGPAGLADWLRAEQITHVVDATHPFAAQMSRNAVEACAVSQTPLLAFERAPWAAEPGDDWHHVKDIGAAVASLPEARARIFLAIGKQNLRAFAGMPQHHYLLRLVDPPSAALPLPDAEAVIARGPFTPTDDLALLQSRRIGLIVAKNSGGSGARAKLDAARILRIRVIMIDRPALPPRDLARSVAEVMTWLTAHPARLGL